MAEPTTFIDPGSESATQVAQLTPDEQDSLQVGEATQEQQEQLLAGKYTNAEELEKAYIELQGKLGQNEKEDSPEAKEEEVLQEESEESSKESSPAVALITEASAEYYGNDGTLSPETIEKFSSMSSQDLVNAYVEMQKANPDAQVITGQAEQPDLSEGEVNSIKNSVGGTEQYDNLVSWAGSNLDEQTINAFDSLLDSGNAQAIQLAVNGLKAQYENANGYEGRMLSGKAPQTSQDVFRSQPELVAAMSDPRYENDPAYRQDVIEKLDRSDLEF